MVSDLRAVGREVDLMQRERRNGCAGPMPPHGGLWHEVVIGKQAPTLCRDQIDRIDEELELLFRDEIVEVDPHPTRLDHLAPAGDDMFELMTGLEIDPQQTVAVRSGTTAPASSLDPEQVVQQRHYEVVVEIPFAPRCSGARITKETIDRRSAFGIAEDADRRIRRPRLDRPMDERLLQGADGADPHRFLQLEDESGTDRLQDGRCASFLAMLGVDQVGVVLRVDVAHGSAAGYRGHPVGEEVPADDQHPGCARTAYELVRRDEDGVLVVMAVGAGRSHLDADIGSRGGEVPERQSSVTVQELGHGGGIGEDACHVRRRREAAQFEVVDRRIP